MKNSFFSRIKTGILGVALILAVTFIPSITAYAVNTDGNGVGMKANGEVTNAGSINTNADLWCVPQVCSYDSVEYDGANKTITLNNISCSTGLMDFFASSASYTYVFDGNSSLRALNNYEHAPANSITISVTPDSQLILYNEIPDAFVLADGTNISSYVDGSNRTVYVLTGTYVPKDLGTLTVNISNGYGGFYLSDETSWFLNYIYAEPYLIYAGDLEDGTGSYEIYDLNNDGNRDTVFLYLAEHTIDNFIVVGLLEDANLSGTLSFNIPAGTDTYGFDYYSKVNFVFIEGATDNEGGEDNGGDNGGDDGGTPYGNAVKNLVNTLGTANGTIYFTEGSAIPNRVMKALAENPNASLNFVFEFEGVKYDYLITSKDAAKYYDEKIDWYGHVWLKNHFTNRAKN